MATATQKALPPRGRVVQDDLTQRILDNREDLRHNRSHAIGKMLQLFLAPDDTARYALDPDVRERMASISKVRGLQLDWGQYAAENVCWNARHDGLVFPFGLRKPPRVSDPRVPGATTKTISQNICDYASGYVGDMQGGGQFIALQPVAYIGVWILDGLYNLVGHPDPVSGKYPALLMKANTSEAHVIYGKFELCSARPGGGQQDMPWNKPRP